MVFKGLMGHAAAFLPPCSRGAGMFQKNLYLKFGGESLLGVHRAGSSAAAELRQQHSKKKVGPPFTFYCSSCLFLCAAALKLAWPVVSCNTLTHKSCKCFLPHMDSPAPVQCTSWGHNLVPTCSHLCTDFSFLNTAIRAEQHRLLNNFKQSHFESCKTNI